MARRYSTLLWAAVLLGAREWTTSTIGLHQAPWSAGTLGTGRNSAFDCLRYINNLPLFVL